MTVISASLVKELREATNVGMMECKKALEATGGDRDKAIQWLRERGLAVAGKRAGRVAKSGIVAADTFDGGRVGAMIEVNCETDFVARNENFRNFVMGLLQKARFAEGDLAPAVQVDIAAKIAEIGENIVFRRNTRIVLGEALGAVGSYVHMGGKIGVLVELGCGKATTPSHPHFQELLRDLTLHIAACTPVALDRVSIPAETLAREREIYAKQVTGKPPAIVEKIVNGKMEKFYRQICLLEQAFVKDPDLSVSALLQKVGESLNDTIVIRRYARYQLGD